jgi:hypothetical protein
MGEKAAVRDDPVIRLLEKHRDELATQLAAFEASRLALVERRAGQPVDITREAIVVIRSHIAEIEEALLNHTRSGA